MITCTTDGIKVSVSVRFEGEHSSPKDHKYVHSYTITIENGGQHTVQLMRRHWVIIDSDLNIREVKGDGVIGRQPILRPGERHQYSSWCPLPTDIGKMFGWYHMVRDDGLEFDAKVPSFILCDSARKN